jgi:hypothetical protein
LSKSWRRHKDCIPEPAYKELDIEEVKKNEN